MKLITITALFLLLVLPFGIASPIVDYPPQRQQVGNNQFYTVTFDEEGEAAVLAKLTLTNSGNESINDISVEIPGTQLRLINVIQEAKLLTTRCVEYNTVCIPGEERICTLYNQDDTCRVYETITHPCLHREQQCKRYEEVYDWPLGYYPVKYQKQVLSKSTTFTFSLPVAIEEQETSSLLLYYKVSGYTKKRFGIWHADFETAKIGYDTQKVKVSLSAVSELHVKGLKSSVDYQPTSVPFAAMRVAEEGIASAELSAFSRDIEYVTGYIKQTEQLDPWESFHVKAQYSPSRFLLYKWRIALTIIMGVAILLGTKFTMKRIRLKKKDQRPIKKDLTPFAKAMVISFTSSMMIYGLMFGAYWLFKNFERWSLFHYEFTGLILILIMAVVPFIIMALIIGPAIYLGTKEGVTIGLIAFGATLIWLIILGVIIAYLIEIKQLAPIIY